MGFLGDLDDLFPDTLVAQPVTTDAFGDETDDGAALTLDCYIEAESKLVRDETGQEVVSSVQAIVQGHNNLTVQSHRYTLPARFNPREDLTAIAVPKLSDEDGALYEEVQFP